MKTLSVGLVIGASLASSVGSAFRDVNKSIDHLSARAKSVELGLKAGRQWRDLRGEAMKLSSAMQAGTLDAVGIKRFRDIRAATVEAGREARKYGLTLRGLDQQLGAMNLYHSRQQGFVARAEARAARRENRSMLRGQLMSVVAPVMMTGALMRPAIEAEESFAGVRKVWDMTDAEAQQRKQRLLKMSTKIPVSFAGLSEIMASAAQAGIPEEDREAFVQDAAKMGIAFDMAALDAGDAMTGLRTIFNLSQGEVVALGDAINHLSNHMDSKAPGIISFSNRLGGIARMSGMSGESVAALGSAFLALKVEPERAARATNDLLMKLGSISKEGKKFDKILRPLGTSCAELGRVFKKDADEGLKLFLRTIKKSKNPTFILRDMIGAGFADEIGLLATGVGEYTKALELVADPAQYAGSMTEEFEARSRTTAYALQGLRNQVNRLGVNIGSALLPGLGKAVSSLGRMAGAAAEVAEAHPQLTQHIGGAVAGFVGFRAAVLLARLGVSHLKDSGSLLMDLLQRLRPSAIGNSIAMAKLGRTTFSLKGALAGASKFYGGLAADFTALGVGLGHVITPVTLGAAAIGSAIFVLWRDWDDFCERWQIGWQKVADAWGDSKIKGIGEGIKTLICLPLETMGSLLLKTIDLWDQLLQKIGLGMGPGYNEAMGNVYKGIEERRQSGGYDPVDEFGALVSPDAYGAAMTPTRPAQHAMGGYVPRRILSWLSEDGPEYVIPVGSAYRSRGRALLGQAAADLGVSMAAPSPDVSAAPPGGASEALSGLASLQAGGGEFHMTIGDIHVHGTPGMDAEALADKVIRKIQDYAAMRRRGAYADASFLG